MSRQQAQHLKNSMQNLQTQIAAKKHRNVKGQGYRSQFGTTRPSEADLMAQPALLAMVADNQYASVAEPLRRGREEAGSESQKTFAISIFLFVQEFVESLNCCLCNGSHRSRSVQDDNYLSFF